MEAQYFSPEEFREWLEENHATETEVFVGFYKAKTGKSRMTWSESVDQALCFGWIDGRGNRVDDERNTIRFTPRRKGSTWSRINIAKVGELRRLGLMTPAGLAAFEARTEANSGIYSHENEPAAFSPELENRFRSNAGAWEFFQGQAPWYRRLATYYVMSAKREETREKRLGTLMDDSAAGRRLKHLARDAR